MTINDGKCEKNKTIKAKKTTSKAFRLSYLTSIDAITVVVESLTKPNPASIVPPGESFLIPLHLTFKYSGYRYAPRQHSICQLFAHTVFLDQFALVPGRCVRL